MEWLEQTDRTYIGETEEALFPGQLKRLLVGRKITKIEDVEGCPGGPNNDCVTIIFDDGSKIDIDAYSGGDIYVTLWRTP